jgi:hypothetical protein
MKAYGYSRNDPQLLEMSEVTFAGSPTALRRLASFISRTADQMERNSPGFDHEHFSAAHPKGRTAVEVVVAKSKRSKRRLAPAKLGAEATKATKLLKGKVVSRVWRHSRKQVGILFKDGSRVFIDHEPTALEVSIT